MSLRSTWLLVGLALTAAGCPSKTSQPTSQSKTGEAKQEPKLDAAALAKQSKQLFGTPPKQVDSKENPVTDEKVALGQMLYHDNRLSINRSQSCNTCHQLDHFGVDNKPTSPGHDGKPGTRNSPTTINAAVQTVGQFWDARAETVEEQAKGPVTNPAEMGMPGPDYVEKVLRSIPGYVTAFKKAFPKQDQPVTMDNFAKAVGAFERRLISHDRFDDFMGGKTDALSDQELAGLNAFMKTGCTTCHNGPDLGGTSMQKLGSVVKVESKDKGKYEQTKKKADMYMFKVPQLRNIAETGPYLHDGSIKGLPEIVKFMALHQLGKDLDDKTTGEIVAFLKALTGKIPPELAKTPELPKDGPDTPQASK
jgi:cytochrome c peroxidase